MTGGNGASALQVSEVRFSYGKHRAVDGVSLEVRPGEIFGLLGPNGAGKTTTIAMISGLLKPESGQVLIFGQESGSAAARERLGMVPQDIALYEELTCRENLRFWGKLYRLSGDRLDKAVARALEQVGLTDRAGERAGRLSGGLKRRLNLAAGLVHGPDLILLDEPTVGIDPQARLRILDVVKQEAAAGRAVLYTSHYLEEAEQICDRLAIVDHGRLLAMGTVAELRRLVGEGPLVNLRGEIGPDSVDRLMQRVPGVSLIASNDGSHTFAARDAEACSGLVRELFAAAARVEDLRVTEPSLQSLFLKLTGKELRD